jgi:hypothetical protein
MLVSQLDLTWVIAVGVVIIAVVVVLGARRP